MNTALWLVQGLLALAFLASGAMKLLSSHEALGTKLAWVASVPSWLPPFIGALEVLGAMGLILPVALRVAPKLTPLAAALLAALMLAALGLHWTRGELALGVPALALLCLCVLVAIGRGR